LPVALNLAVCAFARLPFIALASRAGTTGVQVEVQ
jgi:hypothetical protein